MIANADHGKQRANEREGLIGLANQNATAEEEMTHVSLPNLLSRENIRFHSFKFWERLILLQHHDIFRIRLYFSQMHLPAELNPECLYRIFRLLCQQQSTFYLRRHLSHFLVPTAPYGLFGQNGQK